MKYSINDDEITLGLSIVYIEGIHDIKISKNIGYLSMTIDSDSAGPDKMQHNTAIHLGLHCLHLSVRGF